MKTILVTGATGFIGRRVVAKLVAAGHAVIGLSRSAPEEPVAGVEYVQGDLTDASSFSLSRAEAVDTLVDLAARIPGVGGEESEEAYLRENARSRTALLALLPALRHIVCASTIDVYAPSDGMPLDEEHSALGPQTPYAASKLALEKLYRDHTLARGTALIVLRLSQVYGKGNRPIKAIPRFLNALKEGKELTLTGDGSVRRRYLYVEDAADAFARAVESERDGTYNIAGPSIVSMRELIALMEEATGTVAKVVGAPANPTDEDRVMDIAAAERGLGFVPRVDMLEGLRASL